VIPLKDNIASEHFPLVTIALIVANFVAYILAIRHGGSFISGPDLQEVVKYGSIPRVLTHCLTEHELTRAVSGGYSIACAHSGGMPTWETIFTGMFMHASILHIGGNMLFLWIFGNNVEDALGPVKYLFFYLLGGVVALGLQVAVDPSSTAPTLGASGAIAAVLGAYILLYPRARVLTLVIIIFFFTVIEVPSWIMLGVWFALQAVYGAVGLTNPTGAGGGVAYFAHIGGFAFGLLMIRMLVRRRKPAPPPYPAY
jgi:membrane associated rhomboid family serine protease